MKENRVETLPHFDSLDELAEFFDGHDMGDFLEQIPEADFAVDLKRRKFLFALDSEVARKLSEIARSRKVSSEALANAWLTEKISENRGIGGRP